MWATIAFLVGVAVAGAVLAVFRTREPRPAGAPARPAALGWLTLASGIAPVARPAIRQDTLAFMKDYGPKAVPPTYRELSRMGGEAIAYHGMRGYWLVRYLEEICPGFLRRMLTRRQEAGAIEREMIAELGMAPENFWGDIDGVIADHF